MKRLRIGIDMDDVCVDFIGAFRKTAEVVLKRKFPQEPGDWAFKNWGITADERTLIWDNILRTKDWFFNCDTLPGVGVGLRALERKHDLFFVTARPGTAGESAKRQTEEYLQTVYRMQYPTVIDVHGDKGPTALVLNLDAFIDDKAENLIDIHDMYTLGRGKDIKLFLRNQSHNAEFDLPYVTRVPDFQTFVTHMKELSS